MEKIEPIARTAAPRRFFGPPRSTAVVLGRNGRAGIHPIREGTIQDNDGGCRVAEPSGRFWLERPIPAGWLTVYVGADPEPVTDREPKGYDSRTLEMLRGNYSLHLVGGGLKKKVTFSGLSVPLMVGTLTVLLVLGAAWFIYRRRYG